MVSSTHTRKLITEMVIMFNHFFLEDQFRGFSGSWSAGSFHHTTNSEPGSESPFSPVASSLGGNKAEGVLVPDPRSFSSSSEFSPTSSCRAPVSCCPTYESLVVSSDEDRDDLGWCGIVKIHAVCVLIVKAQLSPAAAESLLQRKEPSHSQSGRTGAKRIEVCVSKD